MTRTRWFFPLPCLLAACCTAPAQYEPPNAKPPDKATQEAIVAKVRQLGQALSVMQRQGVRDPVFADVEIYHKAADWTVRHNEFYSDQFGAWTMAVLDRGLLRASQALRGESPWLNQTGAASARAYRSRVDGSVQPYSVILPADYFKEPKKWRLDVVLHGRDSSISEVKFLYQHSGDKPAAEQPYVTLEIFGRGNNAYRWAGETDVLDAIDAFVATERALGRGELLDPTRVVLRGFSMGGAGTWHLGLHRPDRWCVIGPGAGFTTTRGYLKDLADSLPPYIEDCLHIYDAVDYATNATEVPVVAYAGEKDAQLAAAQNIEAKLKPLNIPVTLLVGTGLAHQFPPEWQKRAEEEYAKYAAAGKGRNPATDRVRFTTYTLRYPSCDWVEILGLDRHYRKTEIDARRTEAGYTVTTANVRVLRVGVVNGDASAQTVKIDGQELSVSPTPGPAGALNHYFEKRDGKWTAALPQILSTDRLRQMQKTLGLQGPIDDAFMDSFLCVRGTGKAWNDASQKYADADLERFRREWNKFLRGDLPVKNDVEVTDEDIAARHLILFGDPASNRFIAQVIDRLPLKWTKDAIEFGGKSYDAATHVPAMIHPSPLNAGRYVVLNSGHTFHTADFRGTNALLYPRLGDYAILKPTPIDKDPAAADVVTAGIFDDFWKVK